jgi:hypothetical protein
VSEPAPVCTLSDEAFAERSAWIRSEILPHARRSETLASGIAWELDPAEGLAEKIDELIALERACCARLVFVRTKAAQPDRLRLEVRGKDPAAVTWLRAAFAARASGAAAPRPDAP